MLDIYGMPAIHLRQPERKASRREEEAYWHAWGNRFERPGVLSRIGHLWPAARAWWADRAESWSRPDALRRPPQGC